MPKATIMIGPAGCGKSTFTVEKELPGAVVSADAYHTKNGIYDYKPEKAGEAHASCLRQFLDFVQAGDSDVIVDNTNVSMYQVAPYIAIAKAYGYEIDCFVFSKADPEECFKRTLHGVPIKTVFHMYYEMHNLIRTWPPHFPTLTHVVPRD
jgi:predicted kinase